MEINIPRAVVADSMKLTFGNIINLFRVVATPIMEKGVASSWFYKVFGIYGWAIVTEL